LQTQGKKADSLFWQKLPIATDPAPTGPRPRPVILRRNRCFRARSPFLRVVDVIRAAFLSAGLYLVLCGTGLLFVDDFRISERTSVDKSAWLHVLTSADSGGRRHIHPPEWLPFTCIGVGGVTMLYAVALPRQ
jgi:hypothetical protein